VRTLFRLPAWADLLLAASLWGGMYVVSRATFGAVPPITLGALRVIIGALALIGAQRASGGATPPLSRSDRRRGVLLGVLVSATIVTQFMGTALATAHDGAVLTTATPVFLVLLAWPLLGERPTARMLLGVALAVVGVGAVVLVAAPSGGAASAQAPLGDMLLLISALCWALFTLAGAPMVRRTSALRVATVATLWSIPCLVPLAVVELWVTHARLTLSWGSVGAVLYLGIGATAIAWSLWYRGVARVSAAVAAVFFFAQPLVGSLLAWATLGEPLPAGFAVGAALLTLAVLIVSWAPASVTKT
jgi:drug/metabolite transporter (DMT)-like permease